MSLSPTMAPYNTADPSASFLSSSCLDFLLIELVPLAHRVTTERDAAAAATAAATATATAAVSAPDVAASTSNGHGALPPASATTSTALTTAATATAGKAESVTTSHHGTAAVAGSAASLPRRLDDDEHLDAMHYRLESQGYRVGQGLVERFSKDRPRFNDTLDVIKFLCKDLWSLVFGKNIDNLKTNHRGVYVLTDNVFRPFSRMSTEAGSQAVVRAQPFLWFPCGIVRGALAALGINATVQAEVNELPGAVFQIKTIPAKP